MEYFAFGETFIEEHKNSHNSPYKFNGKELDEESGLYYYGARYFDPKLSIWASVDPLAEETMDAYGYCYQNPVALVDPDGMKPDPPSKGWNRFWGGMRMVGGALQVTGGIGLLAVPEPTGLTKIGGVIAVAHGADDFQTGLRQLWTGEDTESLTYKGIKNTSKALGASESTANKIATIGDIGLSFVGGGAGAIKAGMSAFSKSTVLILTSRKIISANAALKGKAGIYVHYFDTGKVYVGQATDLSSRPWTSLQELITNGPNGKNKATALKDGATYLKTQFVKLENSGYKTLNELEKAYIKKSGGVMSEGGKTYNIKKVK